MILSTSSKSNSHVRTITLPGPLRLESGAELEKVSVAYETWGELNADRSNAILICHALTGDQYPAGENPMTGRPAWWPRLIGPGQPVDTNRFFVIATNVLGGCMGSTGPASERPNGQVYGTDFPVITIADMVAAQVGLIDALGIERLCSVVGGSMGAMQTLQWCVSAPERLRSALPIAGAARHSAQNIAFYEVGRQAIMADPDWCEGHYIREGKRPERGLSVARMAAHITYVSEEALRQKFDRGMQDREALSFGFDADFQIESYLRYQGRSFVDRFDANSYLYITRAMDYFDLTRSREGGMAEAFSGLTARVCPIAFTSDWHYPPEASREIVRALNAAGVDVSYVEITTDKGHDAFLLEEPVLERSVRGFIDAAAREADVK